MSTRLRNTTDRDLVLFGQTGTPEAYNLEAGGTVEVPGDLTGETGDAYLIGAGDDVRAWPKTVWAVASADTRRRAHDDTAAPAADTTDTTDEE